MPTEDDCPADAALQGLFADVLPAVEQARLAVHLEWCARCVRRLERLAAGAGTWDAARALRERREEDGPGLHRALTALEDDVPALARPPRADPATDVDLLEPPLEPGDLGRLGHYTVRRILGRGGMGIVFEAFDEKLRRSVAVKALAPHLASSAAARARFVREARAAATVRYAHVVPIYAVEDDGPVPYLVLALVRGVSLQARLDHGGPLEPREVLRLGAQIARGLAAAHARGLVHRDVTPANILLQAPDTPGAAPSAMLTDFGLARGADDGDASSGVVAGTPSYMSPEQAEGRPLDHRSDLFSLGSVLYALCAGTPPFRADSALAVLRLVVETSPRPLREINPAVPAALAALVARLHARDPARRLVSAAQVAELLEAQLAAVPRARRRRQVGAALLLAATLLTPAAFLLRPDAAEEPPPIDAALAIDGQTAIPPPRPVNPDRPTPPEQLPPAERPVDPPTAPQAPVRGDLIARPSINRTGTLLAVPCGDAVALFDARTGTPGRVLRNAGAQIGAVALSPDGTGLAVASGGDAQSVAVWNVADGKPRRILAARASPAFALAWASDGKRLAASFGDRTVRVWDADTGAETLTLCDEATCLAALAWSPNGRRLAAGGRDGAVRVYDTDAGKRLALLDGLGGAVTGLAFSSDGALLAAGDEADGRLWDTTTFAPRPLLARPAAWLAFTPDGRTLYSAAHDHRTGTAHVLYRHDTATGRLGPALALNADGAIALGGVAHYALRPDGHVLFAVRSLGTDDLRLRAYDPATGAELPTTTPTEKFRRAAR